MPQWQRNPVMFPISITNADAQCAQNARVSPCLFLFSGVQTKLDFLNFPFAALTQHWLETLLLLAQKQWISEGLQG